MQQQQDGARTLIDVVDAVPVQIQEVALEREKLLAHPLRALFAGRLSLMAHLL